MNTPVVFLLSNDQILQPRFLKLFAKPTKLFVIADEPRSEYFDEANLCEASRSVTDCIELVQ
jgi:hypothetical protein